MDVDKLVTYLAFENLVDNFDDITGPGNNSYLWWAERADQMTVVAWDHNCAFGVRPGGGGTPGGGQAPGADATPPTGATPPAGGGPGRDMTRSNALVDRFNSLLDGEAKVSEETTRLREELYASGVAAAALAARVKVLNEQAGDLLDQATLDDEAAQVSGYFA